MSDSSDRNDKSSGDKANKDTGGGLFGEALKKVFTGGVAAAFMTEEAVRNYLAELKIPKEVLTPILEGASKTKEDIANRVSKEIINVVQKVDWAKELTKLAETHKIKLTIEIEKK